MKTLERLSYLAVLMAAIVVIWHIVRTDIPFGKEPINSKTLDIEHQMTGVVLDLPSVNLRDGQPTLVLALSTHCSFCDENTPLYQQIARMKGVGRLRLVTIFPETAGEAEDYLKRRGIAADVVIASRTLSSLGVKATPTVLLADGQGEVKQSWVGALSKTRENEVLAKLREYCQACVTTALNRAESKMR